MAPDKHEISPHRNPLDWLSLIVLMMMVLVSAIGLSAADWTDYLGFIPTIAFLGVVAGVGLARSRFSAVVAGIFGTCYGLFVVGVQLGRAMDPALIWRDRILALLGRVWELVRRVIEGEPNDDPLMFVFLMAVLFWVTSTYGAWSVFRRGRFWPAVLPAGLVLFVNAYFYIGSSRLEVYLAVYLILALLMSTGLDMSKRQGVWRAIRARVPPYMTLQVARAAAMAGIALVGVAWAAPAFAQSESVAEVWHTIADPLKEISEGGLEDLLSGLRSPAAVVSDFYGENLSLDAGVEPADVNVMEVIPAGLPGYGGRFYWKARTYDYYEAGVWTASLGEEMEYRPYDGAFQLAEYEGREELEFTVVPKVSAMHRLYVPSEALWVSRSADAQVMRLEGDKVSVLSLAAGRKVYRGESYSARASVAVPKADDLRAAGEAYPEWVAQNYLQIPESITLRTKALANALVEGRETPYDKAVAVTSWLRRNIQYSRVTDAPPEGSEPIDWVLFDYRVGFCNYYASAEVIMLRYLGVPARLAAGYARGEYNATEGLYEVHGEDAHAWVEVYFPGYGWVEFEPTTSQPPLVRFESADDQAGPGDADDVPDVDPADLERLGGVQEDAGIEDDALGPAGFISPGISPVAYVLLGAVMVITGILTWLRVDPSSRARAVGAMLRGMRKVGIDPPQAIVRLEEPGQSLVAKVYGRWSQWFSRLGLALRSSQTPHERVAVFATALPGSESWGRTIVDAYARERFGGMDVDDERVAQAWRLLQPRLYAGWLKKFTSRLRRER